MASSETGGLPPDPLSQTFDLVVMGTGLGECMLAAAASRAGLRVLHTDSFEYYGGESASFELKQLPDIASIHPYVSEEKPSGIRSVAQETISADPASKATVFVPGAGGKEQWPIRYHGACPVPEILRPKQRRITLDLLPALTMCRGRAIDALVDSGVAAYLDFVVLQACFSVWSSHTSRAHAATSSSWGVHKLPCTKSDVFEDGSLSFSQKRALMKLLQFALDLRAAEEAERAAREDEAGLAAAAGGAGNSSSAADSAGAAFGGGFSAEEVDAGGAASAASVVSPSAAVGAVESLNERQLGTGRSLLRPQNKQTPSLPFEEYRGKPFAAFLERVGLPPHLQSMMMHAVALLEAAQTGSSAAAASAAAAGGAGSGSGYGSVPAAQPAVPTETAAGMSRLVRYLGAMGRYGETAFILPQYGSGEVAQAFSRACAVHGGIYMLRTSIDSIALVDEEGKNKAGQQDTAAVAAADAKAKEGDTSAPATTAAATDAPAESLLLLRTSEGQEIRCRHLAGTAAFLPRTVYGSLPASSATVGAATAVVSPPLGPADFALAFPGAALASGAVAAADAASEASLSLADLPSSAPAPKDRTRFFLVIPPLTAPLGNTCAVYVLQQGAGNAMTPDDSLAVLNVWTQVDTRAAGAGVVAGVGGSEGKGKGKGVGEGEGEGEDGGNWAREAAVAVVRRVLAAVFGSADPQVDPEPKHESAPAPAPATVSADGGEGLSLADAGSASNNTASGTEVATSPLPTSETSSTGAAQGVTSAPTAEPGAPAAAAASVPLPKRRCHLLFRQLLSYQSKDASPAALRAAGTPPWLQRRLHVLSGRAMQSCRVSNEFDAEEARRVFAAVAPGKRFLGPVVTPKAEDGAEGDADGGGSAESGVEGGAAASATAAADAATTATQTKAESPAEASSDAGASASGAATSSGQAPAAAEAGSTAGEGAATVADAAAAAPAAGDDDLGGLDLDSALALLKDELD